MQFQRTLVSTYIKICILVLPFFCIANSNPTKLEQLKFAKIRQAAENGPKIVGMIMEVMRSRHIVSIEMLFQTPLI